MACRFPINGQGLPPAGPIFWPSYTAAFRHYELRALQRAFWDLGFAAFGKNAKMYFQQQSYQKYIAPCRRLAMCPYIGRACYISILATYKPHTAILG